MQEQLSNLISESAAANISSAKRDLLAKYLRGEVDQDLTSALAIRRRSPEEPPQLSLSQERLWFLDQLLPGAPVYNVPLAVQLARPVDTEPLQRSINEIVRRHEALRTTFISVDGRPVPVVAPHFEVNLDVSDLTQLKECAREKEAQRLAEVESRRPFDLALGPLIRTGLIKLTEQESIFLVTMHHIVSDGWSILIFFRELTALYQAFSQGRPSPLPELPIQYADYAGWQKDSLRGESIEPQVNYWKQKLAGELPVIDLPSDRPRPAMQTHAGARVTLSLSESLTRDLNTLSQREGASLFMTLAAAFKVLLHRYTGEEDIVIGSPISNRPQLETEELIGFFLNNLALRTDLSGNPTFRELLARERETALDAYANQDVPFEKLIEELKPARDLSRTSIFQVYFNLFSFSDRIDLPDGESISFVDAWLQSDETLAKFDLTLYAGVGEREIKLALVYNTDSFSRDRMTEMLAQLECLLAQVAAQPDKRIADLSLVTTESNKFLPDPTQVFAPLPFQSVTKSFAESATRHPHKIAVEDPQDAWTYDELDRRSSQLANHLLASGVAKGDIVAIYGHRSAPLVQAVLGVLKAGAAFTILDPAYPAARLVDCLRLAAPRALIQLEAAGPLPFGLCEFLESLDCCVTLSTQTDAIADCSTVNPNIEIDADDLAYIAFTSGSTGQPKGVMGRHGPLGLFTSWAVDTFGLDETERFCMLSGLAHDPLQRDIFTPLQLGGAICIPDRADLEAPARLRAWMSEQKITVANLTPAMSQLLTDGKTSDDQIESLRYAFLVGDVLTRRDVSRIRQLAPAVTCVNLYGSTETQRAVGYFADDNQRDAKEVLPLGRGIRDVQLLVLNQGWQLCGVGEVGEIYFRSPHLAKGYLHDQALTRERFIATPFTNDASDRLYRTGDLGRYLPDGNVEHCGRADRQIKIRGFRIEPGEVEAALRRHSHVRETAVVPHRNASGETNLVAYVVPQPGATVDPGALRSFLGAKLPAFMVPEAFVVIDSLPLTPNGKLDRRALPAPDQLRREPSNSSEAPRSATEATLVELWREVLSLDQVGIHENFFELGGHSLLAVRLFALIEKRFGQRLPLSTLFQSPTVAQLAAALEKDSSPSWSSLVPIQPRGTRPPFFCVHAVGGNVLEYYDLARHLGADQPFYGLQSLGLDQRHAPHARIEDMAAHYVTEIRRVQPAGPYFIGGRSLGGIIAYEMARQLKAAGQSVGLLALLDSYPVGHQKLSSEAGTLSGKSARFWKRVQSHAANLRGLSLSAQLRYLMNKSQYAPKRIKSKAWRALYFVHEKLGLQLPRALRNVEQFNWLAAHRFVPRLYDGRVTLFWAGRDLRAKFDQLEGWQKLAPGGLEVLEIPGTHLDMIKEPHVVALADKLRACLLVSEPRAVATGSRSNILETTTPSILEAQFS